MHTGTIVISSSVKRTTHRALIHLLIGIFILSEAAAVPLLTGCSRKISSGQVLLQRKIRKSVLTENAKTQIEASALPPDVKREVNRRIDKVPEANTDREQIGFILGEIVSALKDAKTDSGLLSQVAMAAVSKLSELNTDAPDQGLLPILKRPEIAEAIKLLTREGLSESDILKAVVEQVDPTLLQNPEAAAKTLQDPLFSNFSQGAKSTVLAAAGDTNAQRHAHFVSLISTILSDKKVTEPIKTALESAVANVPPGTTAVAHADALLKALHNAAQLQDITLGSRADLVIGALEALLTSSDPSVTFSESEAEALRSSVIRDLIMGGVPADVVVSAALAQLPQEQRDSATEVEALLSAARFESLSPEARAAARTVAYQQFVPAPEISSINDQTLLEDEISSGIPFTISDRDSTLSCLDSVSFQSSNSALLPRERITASGTAPNCVVTVNPLADQTGSVTVTVTVSDGMLSSETRFSFEVKDVNDTPALVSSADLHSSLAQDSSAILTLSAGSDPDTTTSRQTLSYFLVSAPTNGSLQSFPSSAINGGTLVYTPQSGFVGSDSLSYQICDSFSPPTCSPTVTITISVLNVNEPPTALNLSATTLAENSPANSQVGTLSSVDPDSGETFSYSLVSGSGETDNASFSISGNSLRMTQVPDYETQSSYQIRLRTTDGGGLFFEQSFLITIINMAEWRPEAYIKSSNSEYADEFGHSVSLWGDALASSSYYEDENSTAIINGTTSPNLNGSFTSGAVYVYRRTGTVWTQEAYLKAPNSGAGDSFGYDVTLSSDTLAVGAPYEDENSTTIINDSTVPDLGGANDSGAVYVFQRTASVWATEAYLKPANASAGDGFGWSISLSADTLAVGAPFEDENSTVIINGTTATNLDGAVNAGAVYIYRRSGTAWTPEAYLKAPNAEALDTFGIALSLAGDTLAVGANGEDEAGTTIVNGSPPSNLNGANASGAVYIFRRTAGIWALESTIKATNTESLDVFGGTVSLFGDTLAVGTPREDENLATIINGSTAPNANGASNSGAVYIYRRTAESWAAEAYIKASNAEEYDYFGQSVSLANNLLAVGAPYESESLTTITHGAAPSSGNAANSAGAVYLFRRTGSTWSPEAYIKAANAEEFDAFGSDVSLSGDTLAVGAPWESENSTLIVNGTTAPNLNGGATESGAVYIFRNTERIFDPDISVTQVSDTSVTFTWNPQTMGTATSVRIVPFVAGTSSPASGCTGTGSITLNSGVTSHTVTGLSANTTYGFRICATAATETSTGSTIWINTRAPNQAPVLNAIAAQETVQDRVHTAAVTGSDPNGNLACAAALSATSDNSTLVAGSNITFRGNWPSCTMTLSPSAGQSGLANITVTLSDGTLSDQKSFVFTVREGWKQEAYIKAGNSQSNDEFGTKVALSGDTLAVASPREDAASTVIVNGTTAPELEGADSSGAVYVYRRTGNLWSPEAYIKAANAGAGDNFGDHIAVSGDTLAVIAGYEDAPDAGIFNGTTATLTNGITDSGAAYVYRRTGTNWAPEAYIKSPFPTAFNWWGSSIALSGENLVIGDVYDNEASTTIVNGTNVPNTGGANRSGAVYLYRRSGSTWSLEAYLKAVNAGVNDMFGNSVSISGDTLAVGMQYDSHSGTAIVNGNTAPIDYDETNTGAAFVYRRSGGIWAQEAFFKAANADELDEFGTVVALSGDTLAVSAPYEDNESNTIINSSTAPVTVWASDVGAVYIYRRTDVTWVQEAYIKAPNAEDNDEFGKDMALLGNTLTVATHLESENSSVIVNGTTAPNLNGASSSGAVYVFRRSGSLWAPEAYLKAPNAEANDRFGYSVALSGDTIAAGAPYEDEASTVVVNGTTAPNANAGFNIGATYVFRSRSRPYDPDIRVSAQSSTSVSFAWSSQHGSGTTILVAPQAIGTATPPACTDPATVTLAPGSTTHTVSGLAPSTKYGFRFCSTDGTNISGGSTVWVQTAP